MFTGSVTDMSISFLVIATLLCLIPLAIGGLYINYILLKVEMGGSVARYDLRNSVILVLIMFLVIIGFSAIGLHARGRSQLLFAAVMLGLNFAIWLKAAATTEQARRYGVLLSLRRSESDLIFLGGVFWLGFGLIKLFDLVVLGDRDLIEVATTIAIISLGGNFIARGLSPVFLTGGGVAYFHHIIRWSEITGYAWEADKPNILTVTSKRSLPLFSNRTSLKISENLRDDVARIFADNCHHI
jgi:hypothetical protein